MGREDKEIGVGVAREVNFNQGLALGQGKFTHMLSVKEKGKPSATRARLREELKVTGSLKKPPGD